MWCTPAGARPSGSSMSSTKLLVPSGGFAHDNCGETLSPTQFGLLGLLLASFFGIMAPSLKVVVDRVNTFGCALAAPAAHANASPMPPANTAFPIIRFMGYSSFGILPCKQV